MFCFKGSSRYHFTREHKGKKRVIYEDLWSNLCSWTRSIAFTCLFRISRHKQIIESLYTFEYKSSGVASEERNFTRNLRWNGVLCTFSITKRDGRSLFKDLLCFPCGIFVWRFFSKVHNFIPRWYGKVLLLFSIMILNRTCSISLIVHKKVLAL